MSRETFQCISPIDGAVVAERAYASDEEARQHFLRAESSQHGWAEVSLLERVRLCKAATTALLENSEEIALELTRQMGRPLRYGAGELRGFEERALAMCALAEEALTPIQPPPREGFVRSIRRAPVGRVMVLSPWKYPYLTAVNAIIPALLAGNSVLLKHSEQTPLVAERLQQAFDAAGLPKGVFQHLFLSHAQLARLLAERPADQVCFTGSVEGGRAVERARAGTFAGLGLELGGQDAAYIAEDADLDAAVDGLIDGALFNSGQSCCGIERIYIHRSHWVGFLERAIPLVESYQLGDPRDKETTLGPLARAAAAERLRRLIADAVSAGATAHISAEPFPMSREGSAYLAPQLLSGVPREHPLRRDELFGPLALLEVVDDDEAAVRAINDSRYGLTAALWTNNIERAQRIAPQLEVGTVFMNRCDYLDPYLAWTGVKESGRGATLSRLAFEAMTRPQSLHFKQG
ncbi:MAG: aldehyde dehydrogenase family protein [Myxococcota bacterium]|nr:aldehyde dehydrogenase family protein [Myxococcota bacterium]